MVLTKDTFFAIPELAFDSKYYRDSAESQIAKAFVNSPDFYADMRVLCQYIKDNNIIYSSSQKKSIADGYDLDYKEKARVYLATQQRKKAIQYYKYALQATDQIQDSDDILTITMDIWICYAKQKYYKEAIKYYEKALQSKNEIAPKLLVKIYGNMWLCYSYQNNYKDAMGYYEGALEYKGQVPAYEIAKIYNNLWMLFIAKKDYEEATKCIRKWFDLLKSSNSKELYYLLINILKNMWLCYHMQKNNFWALGAYMTAYNIASNLKDKEQIQQIDILKQEIEKIIHQD
jgi:tetratricopeptide (TPR) repeat protein